MANISDTIKEDLRKKLTALQAEREKYIAPLEAARKERDDYLRKNAAIFAKERELATAVRELQQDPKVSEYDQGVSALARALGDLRMSEG